MGARTNLSPEAAEYSRSLRAEINKYVRALAWDRDDYAQVWGRAYRLLAERHGYEPPGTAKNKLAAVEQAGYLDQFLRIVRGMS